MSELNLNEMSLKELKDLQTQVGKAIATFEDRSRKVVMAQIEDLARQNGYSLSELLGVPGTRKRTPATPKYANPADKTNTWSGRGRKPSWFQAALDSGKSPEDLAL